MSSLRELLTDKDVFSGSFSYGKHYILEEVNIKDISGRPMELIRCRRLAYRKGKLRLASKRDERNKDCYFPKDSKIPYQTGDWFVAIPTTAKNKDGLTVQDTEILTNFITAHEEIRDFKHALNLLNTKGISILFNTTTTADDDERGMTK